MKLHRVLRSLPFEPMALSTFEAIDRVTHSHSGAASLQTNTSHAPPYFISPKHDGVRVVSYVGEQVETLNSTCFSRFGRPIHGMFWIEEELRLLRWLCGDPRLALDGELYIHKASGSRAGSKGDVKMGFLAVSALVHRLRGPKTACSTEEEVLQYVASLPHLCLFDIVSYQPSERLKAIGNTNGRGLSQIEKERVSLLLEVMRTNNIDDLEMLRVIPNHSAFSQRLKAMQFLMCLLKRACASPILFPARKTPPTTPAKMASKRKDATAEGVSNIGGNFVKLIQYSLLRSLDDAKRVYLKKYVSSGYEGAVVRCATNVYELREKEKGVLLGLLDPLLSSDEHPIITARLQSGSRRCGRRIETPPLLRTYAIKDIVGSTNGGGVVGVSDVDEAQRVRGAEHMDHQRLVEVALRRCKTNGRRSTTAVKLLPLYDKEFAILKPLLKIPSNDAEVRNLVSVPFSILHGDHSVITTPRTRSGRAASKRKEIEVLVFYGLQCLSEAGRVFNVPLPKMNAASQEALLEHLLEAMGIDKRRGKLGARCTGRRSLTGLYATVKYPSLTEYGVPRFGQVKAIRGGKGWFM